MPAPKSLEPADLRADVALARQYVPQAIEQLVSLLAANDARISLAAATAILERAYGKPTVADVEVTPRKQEFTVIERVIIDRAGHPDR
jgi:hypothetical protein